MQTLIIFLRHPNDIDHLTPVIWKWLQADDHFATAVFPWGIPIAKTDFRIALLSHLDRFQMVELAASDSVGWSKIKILDFIDGILPDRGKICIAFDWLHQKMHKEKFWAKSLAFFARERKIPMVCLPHGDHCHTGNMLRANEISPEATSVYSPVGMFDTLVVPNHHCGLRYQEFQPADRIQVLGSPRYNSEWLEIIDKLAPKFIIPEAENRNKIVLFLRNSAYPIFWEEIFWAAKLITQFENHYLVVVPHTRGEGWETLVDCYPELGRKTSNYTCIEENVYSGSIVKWADVVIDIGTSVVFESVMRGKKIICAEYLHATRSILSKYFANSIVLCRDELYEKLASLNSDPSQRFYSLDEAESFIRDMVHVPDENVLDRYVNLLSNAKIKKDAFANLLSSDNEEADLHLNHYDSLLKRCSDLTKRCDEIEQLVIKCEKANKFHLDQKKHFPRVQDGESPDAEYYRARRDFFMKSDDIDNALVSSNLLLEISPNDSDFEKHYWFGLKLDKMGDSNRGSLIYQQIADDRRVQPELAAWALFKHGEIFLDNGDENTAENYFNNALNLNNKHIKAAIYLTPKKSKLRVLVGNQESCCQNCIEIPIKPLDEKMWEYYFSRRKADYIELNIGDASADYDLMKLGKILKDNLSAEGEALININSANDLEKIKSLAINIQSLGLYVETISEFSLQVRNHRH
ncbi:hypothetical protein [uncultured Desulfosarcina sp.]|uniref:tetratricopeptide repeat protein n=1 Tax=uncultured Desulfosarcina sp. TaxID=218289 RepID=UPI0029C885AA|nr:hypothetical protein [uncultured Desulfosarcina sp.]